MNLNIYSFFSGAGFLDLGFEDNDFHIDFVNEYEKDFLQIYKFAREKKQYKSPQYGYFNDDINLLLTGKAKKQLQKNILKSKNNGLVGFIGGPPCPDFSIAGKNQGVLGVHGKLTQSYQQIILDNMPDFFLFENVKGLWNTKKHRLFYEQFKQTFIDNGYVITDRLVNALEYGVPQDRERVFLFGIKATCFGTRQQEALEILNSHFSWGTNYDAQEIKCMPWPKNDDFKEANKMQAPVAINQSLTVEYWFNKNKVYLHANAQDYFKPKSLERFQSVPEGDVSKKSFKRLHRWRYSPTVAYGNNEVHLHPYFPRRLSVSEALAIQSLPKEYVINPNITLSSKFKAIGNGVPYLVSKSLAHEIKVFLTENVIAIEGA